MPETKIRRREFLNLILGGGAVAGLCAAVYAAVRYIIPPESPEASPATVVAAKVGELAPDSGKIFRFGEKPGLLVRLPDGEYRAFSAVCTHLSCTVQYRSDLKHIWCACHDGHYDLNGVNIAGPPPRPLERFEVIVRADEILVSRKS
jgi:Rieske Fe-S protein